MKVQATATFLYGLGAVVVTTAQVTGDPDGINHFKSNGPFALHVKGHALNSSVDGKTDNFVLICVSSCDTNV